MPLWFTDHNGSRLPAAPLRPGDVVDRLGREDRVVSAEAQLRAADIELRLAGHAVDEETIVRALRAARRVQLRCYPV